MRATSHQRKRKYEGRNCMVRHQGTSDQQPPPSGAMRHLPPAGEEITIIPQYVCDLIDISRQREGNEHRNGTDHTPYNAKRRKAPPLRGNRRGWTNGLGPVASTGPRPP